MIGKLRNNQSGFTIVETVLVLLILVVIGAVGYFISQRDHKKPAEQTSTTTSSNVRNSSRLKSYCDTGAGLCLQYPNTWEATAVDNTASEVAEVLLDASSTANVGYLNAASLGADCSQSIEAEVDTSNPLDPNTLNASNMLDTSHPVIMHVVSLTTANETSYTVVGGYLMGTSENVPTFFVTNTSNVAGLGLKIGQDATVQAPMILSNPNQSDNCVIVGGGPISASSYTIDKASAWYSTPDAKTVLSILKTFTVTLK